MDQNPLIKLSSELDWVRQRLRKLIAERDEYGQFPESAHDDQDRQSIDRLIDSLEKKEKELVRLINIEHGRSGENSERQNQ